MTPTAPEPRSLIADVVHLAVVAPDPCDLHVTGSMRVKPGGASVPVVFVHGARTPAIVLGAQSARVAAAAVRGEPCGDRADKLRQLLFARRLVNMAASAEALCARAAAGAGARA